MAIKGIPTQKRAAQQHHDEARRRVLRALADIGDEGLDGRVLKERVLGGYVSERVYNAVRRQIGPGSETPLVEHVRSIHMRLTAAGREALAALAALAANGRQAA